MKIERNVAIVRPGYGLYSDLVREISGGGENAKITFDTAREQKSALNSIRQAAKRMRVRDKLVVVSSNTESEHVLFVYSKSELV